MERIAWEVAQMRPSEVVIFACMWIGLFLAFVLCSIIAYKTVKLFIDEAKEKENERFRNRVRRVSPKPVSTHVMGRSNVHHHNRLSDEQAGAADHKAKDWIERPNECINAKCIARCSRADYEFYKCTFKDDAKKCPGYREGIYRDDLPLGTFKPAEHYMCDM